MWHEILYDILNNANTVILTLIGLPFFLQLLYMVLSWIKKRQFPKSNNKAKVAILICARNEEDVIGNTVRKIFEKQTYSRELYDVYVVAHNCSDRTAQIAKEAGAIVLEHNTEIKMACAALNYGFSYLINLNKYDFYIKLDADNLINDEFLNLMNDAYQAGVDFAGAYESALNITQNKYTAACGLYYAFNSRIAARVKERLNLSCRVNGPGSMYSHRMLVANGGFNCSSITEDAEFLFDRILDGYKARFVEDAIVYEDLPSTFKDTYARNRRIGFGCIRLIFHKGFSILFKGIKNTDFTCIENFLTTFFILICVILCSWIPLFYVYDVVYLLLCGLGTITTTLHDSAYYMTLLMNTLTIAGIAIGLLFVFAGWLQGFILVFSDYKKLGAKRKRDLIPGALLFPVFSVIYIITITLGVISRPKPWIQVKRNVIDRDNIETNQ